MCDNKDERITELELRFMHQENNIQELNDAVYRQEQAIVRLERQVAMLVEQLRSLPPAAGEQDQDERPPHY